MYSLAALSLAIALLLIWRWKGRRFGKLTSGGFAQEEKFDEKVSVEPLRDFDWQQTPPAKHRPFKPVYHITMGKSKPSCSLHVDSEVNFNYLNRVTERRQTIQQNMPTVLGAVPEGIPALHETWSYLLGDYLPTRYPTMFSLSEDGQTFHNNVTKTSLPLTPPEDPNKALQAIGETVEDDIFLLVETPEGHRAVAFVCCHPAGFDPSDKLGKLLKDIHTPVPSYEKIGASMERFFSRLQVGKSVKRMNWSISTDERLFSPSGLHIYDGDKHEEDEDIDISKTRLRQELQTLTRLPKTGAIMFSFKTYLTPLEEIKDEGLGPQVADAIEGLKTGNAPGMWVYKGATRWGKGACEYLRS
ncbi:hypothetical protein CkaCkLH20_11947 [Colletotrichum karsti]|uniref:DUF3445 domain containing protein n=1 Tax=Colletotrichum karsti TaxID=1095194 RepID=A0A9P6HX51_9PEZI|nr:uncharacterized protein CkaCkLH20_11947 [Colletotrichum karsti]KAF9870641.1 hypothetical protein CkaCkLH20_11947 [Colletotrichum karsti]